MANIAKSSSKPADFTKKEKLKKDETETKRAGNNPIDEVLTGGDILSADISEEMKTKYIDYSMSVIVARALPDVKDGLKPVQRRILYSMYKLGILPGSAYKKSARTVGDVIAKYHPHGDVAVYDAMVRMAQPFNLRYPLVDGQGNFGSIDGDPAAAMRYTESRLTKIALEMLKELGSQTVNYAANYDGAESEPVVLPTLTPNLLMNGADGIAVGMATRIPTHNLSELIGALLFMTNKWRSRPGQDMSSIPTATKGSKKGFKKRPYSLPDLFAELKKYDPVDPEKELNSIPAIAAKIIETHGAFAVDVTVEELMKFIKGPDFPTGAVIYDVKSIKEMYATGQGRVLMRAVANIEETKDRYKIIVSAVPYQVNKARMVEKIANLVRDKKIKGISDLRDESNREGIRVVIELKRGVAPKPILASLYRYTEMQVTYHGNFVALVDGEPRLLTLREILEEFLKHRQTVVIRRTLFELYEFKARAHILEGLKIALDHLDEVIKTIRESKDAEIAKTALMKRFKLSELQAQAILDMQLRRLAALERKKIEDELKETLVHIDSLIKLLSSADDIIKVIEAGLNEINEKYGDARRTKVIAGRPDTATDAELVPEEQVAVMLSKAGYIKRLPAEVYKTQHRGGKGVMGASAKDGDYLSNIFICNTRDKVLFFTNLGKVYQVPAYEIPEFSKQAKGQPVVNLISLTDGEKVTSVLTRRDGGFVDEDMTQEDQFDENGEKTNRNMKETETSGEVFLVMGTKRGVIKRSAAKEFENIRNNGLISIKLDKNDELLWVRVTDGKRNIVAASSKGRLVRFKEKEAKVLGRSARGVRCIKLPEGAEMIGLDVVRQEEDRLLCVSDKGFGKITYLNKYQTKHRGGKGMLTFKVAAKTGDLTTIRVLDHPKRSVLIMSKAGHVIKSDIDSIRVTGRVASGVRLIKLDEKDMVTSVACW